MICAPKDHIIIHSPTRSRPDPAQGDESAFLLKNATTGLKETPGKPSKGWTPERRAAQAERARAQKPWLRSTGPRTRSGKKSCRMNGLKHGHRSDAMRRLSKLLNAQKISTARWRTGRYHPPRRRFTWLRDRIAACTTATARHGHQNRLGFRRYHTFSGES